MVRAAVFFFNATATTEIYTLALHGALPICKSGFGVPLYSGSQLEQMFLNFVEELLSPGLGDIEQADGGTGELGQSRQ